MWPRKPHEWWANKWPANGPAEPRQPKLVISTQNPLFGQWMRRWFPCCPIRTNRMALNKGSMGIPWILLLHNWHLMIFHFLRSFGDQEWSWRLLTATGYEELEGGQVRNTFTLNTAIKVGDQRDDHPMVDFIFITSEGENGRKMLVKRLGWRRAGGPRQEICYYFSQSFLVDLQSARNKSRTIIINLSFQVIKM